MQRSMKITVVSILFTTTLALLTVELRAQKISSTLKIGDKAPPLTIKQWIKGTPIKSFEIGSIYLVELTAVHCPPCRKVIPHLTELAKQYEGRIAVISVFTGESNRNDTTDLSYIRSVRDLVQSLGEKIHFTVASDVPQQTTYDDWKITGVPKAFVIDRNGNLAWVGNPISLTADVLQQIIIDTFNPESESRRQQDLNNYLKSLWVAKKNGGYLSTVKAIDSLIELYPRNPMFYHLKFSALAGDDDEKANEWMQWMLSSGIKNFVWVKLIDHVIYDPRQPDYRLAIEVANRAFFEAITSDERASIYAKKIKIYNEASSRSANFDDRVKYLEKAIDECRQAIEYCKLNSLKPREDEFGDQIYRLQYRLLAMTDHERANDLVRWMLKTNLTYVDWYKLLREMSLGSDYDLELLVADQVITTSKMEMKVVDAIYRKGRIYIAKGDIEKALEEFKEAVVYSKSTGKKALVEMYERKLVEFQTSMKRH